MTLRNSRRRRVAAALLGLAAAATLSSASPAGAAGAVELPSGAAGIWAASLEGVHGVAPDATVRQIARVSVAGAGIRVRLGNPFGSAPVVVRNAWLGRPVAPGAARLTPGSNHRLTFGGARTVSIPPGQMVLSDVPALALALGPLGWIAWTPSFAGSPIGVFGGRSLGPRALI